MTQQMNQDVASSSRLDMNARGLSDSSIFYRLDCGCGSLDLQQPSRKHNVCDEVAVKLTHVILAAN